MGHEGFGSCPFKSGRYRHRPGFVSAARGQVSWLLMVNPPPIEAANLGMADSLILMVLALVVFGPRRLPQIGRQIGKLMYEFRKASNDFKFQMEEELRNAEDADRRKREEAERQQRLALSAQSAGTEATAQPPAPESTETSATPDPSPEASYPRIQPPSTGEPIAAARPGDAVPEPVLESAAPAAAEEHPAEKEAAADENGAVTEQAAHNG
jgi:sec-independent protein translocase protein TatB